jgi:cytochrome c oxidase cbb3-type subunit IV
MNWTNFARELFTVFCFVSFLLFSWIAYSRRSKKRYDEVARMIVADDDTPHQNDEQQPCDGAR